MSNLIYMNYCFFFFLGESVKFRVGGFQEESGSGEYTSEEDGGTNPPAGRSLGR